MENLVEQIQRELDRLGFPDMRTDLMKGILEGTPVFRIESARCFDRGLTATGDFLQYSVDIEPRAADNHPVTSGKAILLRILADKEEMVLNVRMATATFDVLGKPLPTIQEAYVRLREKLARQQRTIQKKQHDSPGRQLRPGRKDSNRNRLH